MSYSSRVNIKYTIVDISRFCKSIEQCIKSLEDLKRNVEENYRKGLKYIEDNLKKIDACIDACNKQQDEARRVISDIENLLFKLRQRSAELASEIERYRQKQHQLYDVYLKCCRDQTKINNSKPKKSGSGPEADEAYKAAVKAWNENKAAAQKAVDGSYQNYLSVKNAADRMEQQKQRIEAAIRDLEQYKSELYNIISRLDDERRRLESLRSQYKEAKSELESAYNSFQSAYYSASQTLNDVARRAKKAQDNARRVNEIVGELCNKHMEDGAEIHFTSISGVSDCADEMERAAAQYQREMAEIARSSRDYGEQVTDSIMNSAVEKLREITSSQDGVGELCARVSRQLESLADALQNYENV